MATAVPSVSGVVHTVPANSLDYFVSIFPKAVHIPCLAINLVTGGLSLQAEDSSVSVEDFLIPALLTPLNSLGTEMKFELFIRLAC